MNHTPKSLNPLGFSTENTTYFFTNPSTWESTRYIFKFTIVRNYSLWDRISGARYENLWKLVCHISTWIPTHHPMSHIRSEYLWDFFFVFFLKVSRLIYGGSCHIPVEKRCIYDDILSKIFSSKANHIFTYLVGYWWVILIFSFPCRDNDDLLSYIGKQSGNDTRMILVWRIKCSSIHNIFLCIHMIYIKC